MPEAAGVDLPRDVLGVGGSPLLVWLTEKQAPVLDWSVSSLHFISVLCCLLGAEGKGSGKSLCHD